MASIDSLKGFLSVLAIIAIPSAIHGQATIQTVAGSAFKFPASTVALGAPLGNITGVAADGAGNVYATDATNQIVVKLSAAGVFSGWPAMERRDSPATAAQPQPRN